MQQYDQAIQYYTEILIQNPNHKDALYNIGLSYHSKMEHSKALYYYVEAIKCDPNMHQAVQAAHSLTTWLCNEKKIPGAEQKI